VTPPAQNRLSPSSSAAPATSENLLPAILAAVEAYATVGEISDALRRVFANTRNPSLSDFLL